MAARRKQEAVDVPATRAEADALVRAYTMLEHRAGAVRGFAEVQIAKSKADRDVVLALIEGDQSALFKRLKAWWETTGKDEAKDKRSLDIDGTQIGLRKTTPKLGFLNKMKEADILGWLRKKGLPQFIRTKEDIDKQALIKALGQRSGCEGSLANLLDEAVEVTQKDEFYIAVAPLETTKIEGQKP
jgi:phage host-nuclease inhibitor protein Gam